MRLGYLLERKRRLEEAKTKNEIKIKKKRFSPRFCTICDEDKLNHKQNGIGGETYAWNVIIPKASFAIQMKLAQQNKLLARIANSNAELEMKKFQREIKNKKYIARRLTNPNGWAFYRALIWLLEEQKTISTRSRGRTNDMSSLGLLSKAERTGNNISKYGFGREVGCPYFWSPWVDDLYSPDWHIKINTRYPWKTAVCELSTGKRRYEEWTFLPRNWPHELSPPHISKNFVAFQFYRSFLHEENNIFEFMGSSDEDFMVLNLISRKTYWVKVNPLAVKLKNMCRNDHEGQAIDWNGLNLMMASVDKITKEENSLACRCTFVFSRFFDMDQFENLRMGVSTERTIVTDLKLDFDENKEIISTDVKTATLVNSDEIDLTDDDFANESSDEDDDRGVAEGDISDDGDIMNNRI